VTPPAAATAAGRPSSLKRSPAPRSPRRVSGPARRPSVAPTPRALPLGARLRVRLRELPDARLLDRLIRGRAWIVLVGILLMGIVVMQVSLLKLNTGIGRSVEATSTLERKNSALRLSVSRLSSGERIQRVAARMGMVMPAPVNVKYLSVRPSRDARSAIMTMRVPKSEAQQLAATNLQATQITGQPASTTAPVDPIAPSRDPKPILPQTQTDPGTTQGGTPAAGTGGTTTTTTQQQQQQTAQQVAPDTSGGATVAPPVGG
jgi:cell division protein FtsL